MNGNSETAISAAAYEAWLRDVGDALQTINMPLNDWQGIWPFDFRGEFAAGTSANNAAAKANRFWWKRQNETLGQECKTTPECWLPRNHQGECEPV